MTYNYYQHRNYGTATFTCRECGTEFVTSKQAHPKWCPKCRAVKKSASRRKREPVTRLTPDIPVEQRWITLFLTIAEKCNHKFLWEWARRILMDNDVEATHERIGDVLDWYVNCENCTVQDYCPRKNRMLT